ncbi:MAG: nitrous oxide reductase family maturation protein NosD [Phycisphaeraceae bacterium]|nr:nitrous oxide reductase family maturation protein NosD [Phycisphaeraceae bacterium]
MNARMLQSRCAVFALVLGAAISGAVAQEHEAPAPLAARPATPRPLGAIGRALAAAPDGAVVEIGPGVYHEHLRITRPVTLVGVGMPVIDGGGSGDIVEIAAPEVTLRGFVIRNTGIDLDKENAAVRVLASRATIEDCVLEDILFGIDLRDAPDSVVRSNRIGGKRLDVARRGDGLRLWRADRTLVEGNTIHDGRDAILWYSKGVVVRGNVSHNCRYGLHLMYSDEVTIEGNRLERNSVGVYLMYSAGVELRRNLLVNNRGPSGYGIGLKETDRFVITDNVLSGNRVGVYIDGSPFTNKMPGMFRRNTLACNDIGVTFLPSARNNEFVDNNFIDNIEQVSVAGRGSLSANRFWVGERGNYWSDYTGYDQNRDGIGDFVHESQTLFENMMDREPKLRLFLFSPAQQAVEFVGRAVPSVRPEPKFVDEVPLMRPAEVGLNVRPERGALVRLGGVGAALLLVGGLVLGLARSPRDGQPANGGVA